MSIQIPNFYGYSVKFSPFSRVLGLVGGNNFGFTGKEPHLGKIPSL